MRYSKRELLPRQFLLENKSVQLIRMDNYVHALSNVPHRHDHYTLMWITKGHGKQMIDEKEYDMLTNRVFFIHPGQVHTMKDFERDGLLLMFDEVIYKTFLRVHPLEELNGIMNIGGNFPYVDMDKATIDMYTKIFSLLQTELQRLPKDGNILLHLIALLILGANRLHQQIHRVSPADNNEAREVVLQLRRLIEQYYKTQQTNEFYAGKLNLQPRRLNDLARKHSGHTIHELLEERLLTESKILLDSTALTVKEISYTLGFNDPAYFNRFFKKLTGTTPICFRNKHE